MTPTPTARRAGTASPQAEQAQAQQLQRLLGRLARLARLDTSEGLTPSQLTCLGGIVREGPLRVSEVAARDAISPPALSRVLARLEEKGLITRTADPTDRRAVVLAPTAKGRRTMQRISTGRTALLADGINRLEPAEADALLAALPALEALSAALARPTTTARRRTTA